MAEDANAPQNEQIAEADAVKTEDMPQEPAEQKDVLEEDDDFEEFKDDGYDDNDQTGEEQAEWEDNWDDEVEGEDDYAKRLRAELEAQSKNMQQTQ